MVAAVETMAYVGEVPWHGLGNKVEEGIDLDDFRRNAGLDWEVKKRPVLFAGTCLPGANTGLHTFKDKFVLARDTDERPYAVVSGRYKPVQPKQVFEFFRELLDQHGMKMHTAGRTQRRCEDLGAGHHRRQRVHSRPGSGEGSLAPLHVLRSHALHHSAVRI
jgi:hypothetical protein